eukprot:scaffold146925_cov64-Attheya_sp.AAC.1
MGTNTTSISITDLTELLPAQLSRARNNVKHVCTCDDVIGELFLSDTNDLLLQWKSDAACYADDQHFFKCQFQSEIAPTTSYGFPFSWYSLSDNIKHHGRKQHVLLIMATKGHKDMFLNPWFQFVTASEAVLGAIIARVILNLLWLVATRPLLNLLMDTRTLAKNKGHDPT